MMVKTLRFGDIEVDEKNVFEFAKGLPGFPQERRFVFLPHETKGAEKPVFAYLQSVSTPELTFLLADPFHFFSDYEFVIDDATETELGLVDGNYPMVWSIAIIPGKVDDMTVNLAAPLLFNLKNQKAEQVIMDNNKYSTKQKLFPDNIRARMAGGQSGGEVTRDAGTQPKSR
jgi:flagellar assembly factor FliW